MVHGGRTHLSRSSWLPDDMPPSAVLRHQQPVTSAQLVPLTDKAEHRCSQSEGACQTVVLSGWKRDWNGVLPASAVEPAQNGVANPVRAKQEALRSPLRSMSIEPPPCFWRAACKINEPAMTCPSRSALVIRGVWKGRNDHPSKGTVFSR